LKHSAVTTDPELGAWFSYKDAASDANSAPIQKRNASSIHSNVQKLP